MLKKSDYFYSLPQTLIAQEPLPERSASRLMLVPPAPAALEDRMFGDLVGLLRPGDLLLFNDTRVLPARLWGKKPTGGRVEILIEQLIDSNHARVHMRANHPLRPATPICMDAGGVASVVERDGPFYILQFAIPLPLAQWLHQVGQAPLPPYIQRDANRYDETRYQTVFARHQGAVAAPTAGLHFDLPLLERLRDRGVAFATVTLHIGAGTFQPVRHDDLDQHQMHREWCQIDQTVIDQIARTREQEGRVVAVGTTVVRTLESALDRGTLRPFEGYTRLFIRPGYVITSIDALLTNFHLPESTLLMLVAAFAGYQRMRDAYQHAIAQRYRFFSFGDAMLLAPHGL